MTGKSRSWTPERKAKQSQWMAKNRPWEKSTGPKTSAGKNAIKNNALKHGFYSKEVTYLRRLLTRIEKNNAMFSQKRSL